MYINITNRIKLKNIWTKDQNHFHYIDNTIKTHLRIDRNERKLETYSFTQALPQKESLSNKKLWSKMLIKHATKTLIKNKQTHNRRKRCNQNLV